MLAHLGAMLGRRRAMLVRRGREVELCWPNMRARQARRRIKKQTQTKMPQKKPKPHATEGSPPGSPPGSPQVGWGPCWPMLGAVSPLLGHVGPCWANLGPMLPHLDAVSAHRKHMLSNLGPVLAQQKTKRKNHGKTHGFARFWHPC